MQYHSMTACAVTFMVSLLLVDFCRCVQAHGHHRRSAARKESHNRQNGGGDRRSGQSPQPNKRERKIFEEGGYSNIHTVDTKVGEYRGKITDIQGQKVAAFLGIRYGQPTGEESRFRKPKRAKKLEKPFDAFNYPNSCYQWKDDTFGSDHNGTAMWNPNTDVSEDCLFLNVWMPLSNERKKNSKKLLPVMVWFYGGGFYSGTSSLDVYNGHWLAGSEQVVVVSMNYRVALFGFLALGIDEAPGNAGLWDQNLALHWVKENIRFFRGDKNRVTLFGESAGAASVSMHILSEKSNNLFQNAILQSASALSPWAIVPLKTMQMRGAKLAKKMDCTDYDPSNMSDIVACLISKEAEILVNREINNGDLGTARFQNAAIIDEDFLTAEDLKKLQDGNFYTPINLMTGFNANEGNYFLAYGTDGFNPNVSNGIVSYSQYRRGLNRGLWGYPFASNDHTFQQSLEQNSSEIILQAIDFQYTNFKQTLLDTKSSDLKLNENNYMTILDRAVGDLNFVCPAIDFIVKIIEGDRLKEEEGSGEKEKAATMGRKYLYKFLHRSTKTPWPEWMGTLHGYEIEFAFGIPLNTTLGYTDKEVDLAKLMMKYWANFAKTGDPNFKDARGKDGEPDPNLPFWPEYDTKNKSSLVLSIEVTAESQNATVATAYQEKHTKDKHCSFWNDYYPLLLTSVKNANCPYEACRSTSKGKILHPSSIMLWTFLFWIISINV